jgi:hypothetical protein
MLKDQEPESSHLDYKEKRALLPPNRGGRGLDSQKRAEDISKDVSSFLNSDGGVLIYEIREDSGSASTGGAPLPFFEFDPSKDGYSRYEMTKETIENLITSNIRPKPASEFFSIHEIEVSGRIVFIVEVEAGIGTAYQASDLRYYQRSHYKSEPMEHYQIELLKARGTRPDLQLVAGLTTNWESQLRIVPTPYGGNIEWGVHMGIRNLSETSAETALIEIGQFPNHTVIPPTSMLRAGKRTVRYIHEEPSGFQTPIMDEMDWFHLPWNPSARGERYQPLFNVLEPIWLSQMSFRLGSPKGGDSYVWCWRIQSANMQPRTQLMSIEYHLPYALVIRELEWDFQVDIVTG